MTLEVNVVEQVASEVKVYYYTREYMLSLNDPNLPLPAGFKRYTGLMRDDPTLFRRRSSSRTDNSRNWKNQHAEWNDDDDNEDLSSEGLASSKYATQNDTETRVTRYRGRGGGYYRTNNRNRNDYKLKQRYLQIINQITISEMIKVTTEKKPDEYTWYYRDMTNAVQGPYEAEDMQKWYKEGYFAVTTMLRREDDVYFQPLLVLIQKAGNFEEPFMTARPSRVADRGDDQKWPFTDTRLSTMNVLSDVRFVPNLLQQNAYGVLHTRLLMDHRWDNSSQTKPLLIEDSKSVSECSRIEPFAEDTTSIASSSVSSTCQPQWLRDDMKKPSSDQPLAWAPSASSTGSNQEDSNPVQDASTSNMEPSWAAFTSGSVKPNASSFISATEIPAKSFREIQQEEEEKNTDKKPEIPAIESWRAFAASNR